MTFSQGAEYVGVVGGIFDEGGEDYPLFASRGKVVVVAGPAVSWIPNVNGVEVKGVGDVRDVADWGTRRLILFIISINITPVIINLAIFIIFLLDDGY